MTDTMYRPDPSHNPYDTGQPPSYGSNPNTPPTFGVNQNGTGQFSPNPYGANPGPNAGGSPAAGLGGLSNLAKIVIAVLAVAVLAAGFYAHGVSQKLSTSKHTNATLTSSLKESRQAASHSSAQLTQLKSTATGIAQCAAGLQKGWTMLLSSKTNADFTAAINQYKQAEPMCKQVLGG